MWGVKIPQKIMAPPLSVIKIEQYCGARGRGALGTLKSYKDNGVPSLSLRLLTILLWGLGKWVGGIKIPQKIMVPPLSVIKIVKYCDVWGGGGGAKILQKIMAPPLSVIKIEQYCGARGRGALGTLKSYKDNGVPSLSLRLLTILLWGLGKWVGGIKIPQKIMVPPLSVIKIVKYCGVGGGGTLIRGRKILHR